MSPSLTHRALLQRFRRGLSLVELMVGIVVGMFVVAAASTLVVTQLTENRKLLLELQVQQDLRATADIITRELRRAGSTGTLLAGLTFVWSPGAPGTPGTPWSPNDNAPMTPASGAAVSEVSFRSGRTQGEFGPYGFRLNDVSHVIETRLLAVNVWQWQALTDASTLKVNTFTVKADPQPDLIVPCQKSCADGSTDCWPRIAVRKYTVVIAGESVSDPNVKRSVSSVVRVRSDAITADPALGVRACPA